MQKKIIGIDFSGAKLPAKKIWICEGIISNNKIHINICQNAKELFGGNHQREIVYENLINYIKKQNNSYIGFDFPFSLSKEIIREKTWDEFILKFRSKFKNEFEFRDHYRQMNGGKEIKRQTDLETKTPFCPYNLRLYRQTFFGIQNILYPIVNEKLATVLPMQKLVNSTNIVVEICPASTLKNHNLYLNYKGKEKKHQQNRKEILDYCLNKYSISINPKEIESMIDDTEGDALDSLIALIATYNCRDIPDHDRFSKNKFYQIEGLVYI